MADFKGFKQVSLSTYLATSEENRKDYLWLVREFSGETVISSAIYFGNRKYADLTGDAVNEKVENLIESIGGIVDENGEWVGFLPIEEHEILGNSGVTNVFDALSALESAILSNADAISGKLDRSEFVSKISELESEISGVTGDFDEVSEKIDTISGKVENLETEIETKADASALETLSGKVENLETKVEEEIADVLSAMTEELEKKADASDVYTKSEVYTKEEVDAKVVGTFKFKGDAESISADETTIIVDGEPIVAAPENEGWVYQIGDAEYASNGEKWVKLGFNIDLSEYAKKTYVDSAITEEAAAREELAGEVVLVQSALTAEIEARQELEETVEDLDDRSTITANTYTDAAEMQNLPLGKIIYVLNEEEVSGITYGAGAYINTQGGLRKLDSTTPSSSTTLEERVEALENAVGDIESEIGDTVYSGGTITEAIAGLQNKMLITGDDVE